VAISGPVSGYSGLVSVVNTPEVESDPEET
jgi:hypothetical protein